MSRSVVLLASLSAFLAAPLRAQYDEGDPVTALSLHFSVSPVGLTPDDLAGRAIVLFFFKTTDEASAPQAAVIQKNSIAWKEQGLLLVGVNSETEPVLKAWLKANPANFPVASDSSDRLFREFGFRVAPAAVVIDARRRFVWKGHPGSIPPDALARASQSALKLPFFAYPACLRSLRNPLSRNLYARALKLVETLEAKPEIKPDERAHAATLRAAIEDLAKSALEPVSAFEAQKEYTSAVFELEYIKSAFDGFSVAKESKEKLEKYTRDPLISKEIEAGKALELILDGSLRKGRYKEAVQKFEGFVQKFPGSRAAAKASDLAAKIRADGRYDINPECAECKRLGFACDKCKTAAREEAKKQKP